MSHSPDPDAAQCWNGGLYFAKADARLLVPKRNPWLGWTLNLGHPLAEPALLAALVLPVLLVGALARTAR
jgi:uncharacterized membrane protein